MSDPDRPETLPLGAAQEGIWTGQEYDRDSPAFNTAEYVEIHGPVDVALLEVAIRQTVAETDAVNVAFGADDEGHAWQRVRVGGQWPFRIVDVSMEPDPLGTAKEWMRIDLAAPIDLRDDMLYCHVVFVLGPEHVLWYHRVHHIALDGYGLSLVARRVAELYTALVEDRDPPKHPFGSLASVVREDQSYLDSPKFAAARDYWVGMATGRPAPVVLARRTGKLARSVIRVSAEFDGAIPALKAVASQARAMWTETLAAGFAAYLHRMTGAEELTLALPVMVRLGSVSVRVPCMVTNVVPLWVRVEPGATFTDLTAQVSTQLRDGRPHLRYRYEQLRRDLKLVANERKLFGPSVNIMPFDYRLRFAGQPASVHNVSAGLVEDMVVHIYDRADGHGLRIVLDANPNCYDEAELTRHLDRFMAFLGRITDEPDVPVTDIDLLLDGERELLLHAWNDTARPVPDVTVPDLFAAQAAATPDRTALVACDATLTFAELNGRANRLARWLVERGAGPDQHVALLLPRTSDAVVALLAVLKAGAAYVPIDPDYPDKRVEMILADSEPVLVLDELPALDALSDVDLPDTGLRPHHAACLIYTSGSTGTPKGVVIEHRGLVNLFHHHRDTLIRPNAGDTVRRAALSASLSFDTSWEGLLWLLDGHELHFIDDDLRRQPAAFLEYVSANEIDFMDITPTYAEELLSLGFAEPAERTSGTVLDAPRRPAVVALGGEATGPALWTRLRDAGMTVYNLYGPTECTVDTLWCRLDESPDPIVGRPLTNTRAYVLDKARRLVPPGVVGELYLAGAPVARGYHDRPELTAQRFLPDPFGDGTMYRTGDLATWRPDGTLEFLGRADDQVKIRGFRIELGEIEAVLASHPGVAQAAVIPREDPPAPLRLVGYVVPSGDAPEAAELRQFLAERLPDYMVPPAYVALERIPRNTNGKLDRAALPAPEAAALTGHGPRNARERVLCGLFAELLGLDEVGIDDDFFSLGGHSLLVAKLILRVRDEFGANIGIRTVFEAPTVAKLATALERDTRADDVLLPMRATGDLPPLFCVAPATGLALAYTGLLASLPGHPLYGLQMIDDQTTTVADLAANLVCVIRQIQPAGPYHLLGASFGGLVAHEMAAQLQDVGERVELVALLDSYPFPEEWADLPLLSEGEVATDLLGDLDPGQVALAYRAFKHHSRLGAEWTPRRIEGDVLLFEATEDKTPDWPGPDTWRSHVDGRLDVYRIACTHNGMTSATALAHVGATIAARTNVRRVS
jgi:amino acid adenylation domain-containing protein